MEYKLKYGGEVWTDEEMSVFFDAITRYRRTKSIIENYPSVYAWIGGSVLKGSRSTRQVQAFAELVYVTILPAIICKYVFTLSHFISHC